MRVGKGAWSQRGRVKKATSVRQKLTRKTRANVAVVVSVCNGHNNSLF